MVLTRMPPPGLVGENLGVGLSAALAEDMPPPWPG